ncbi:MAG: hypothetical protein Q7J68_06195 [Thermoplasmata archaeon]|nr:hypothetical protein [Thermoplasmata archaeon]
MTTEKTAYLIKKLKRYDTEAGYRMALKEMNLKMEKTVKGLLEAGEDALDELHELLLDVETWSCYYSLKIIRGIGSERSIPFLMCFLIDNEDSAYYEGNEEAMYALTDMGGPAVEPLLYEIKSAFRREEFYIYLVCALTRIVDDRVYDFIRYTLEDYLAKPDKYIEWFDIVPFMFDLSKHGRNETTVPLLRAILVMDHLGEHEKVEIRDTIMIIEDPEGWKESLNRNAESMKAFFEKFKVEPAVENGLVHKRTVKVGKDQPCPCGSGKKTKKCCRKKFSET